MSPIMHSRIAKLPTNSKVLSNKKITTGLLLLSLLGLGSLLIATQPHAAEVNLYAKNYKEQNAYHLKSLSANPDTKMLVSNHKDDDNISMLESGYDMMGSSGFDAADVPADMALQHAKSIKADTVLVYSKYGSAKTGSSKLALIKEAAKKGGEIDAKDLVEEPPKYEYYASYWAKLPMPLLGVHVIKLKKQVDPDDADTAKPVEEPGLKIIAVIQESPAAKAQIVKGDTLLKIGDVTLVNPDDLFAAVKRYAGQSVPVELQRGEDEVKTTVALNSRN